MTGRDVKRKKRHQKLVSQRRSPEGLQCVCVGGGGGGYKGGVSINQQNTTSSFSSLERCIPLKATEFKSNMALSENGIKGCTINLSYSPVTGHLRAKILMGSFSPFLLPCSRCMIHGLSFSGLHFHLIVFSLLLLSDSFVNFLRCRDVRTSTPFMI